MPRTLPQVRFQDGLAVGWAFGVSTAFKAALDIIPMSRVLSGRGTLAAELAREGILVSPGAKRGEAKETANLFENLRLAGLGVVDIRVEATPTEDRVLILVETEGSPAKYKFSPGDVFYDPPKVHKLQWGEGLKILRRCVQITNVDNEHITAMLQIYLEGKVTQEEILSCSQMQFAQLLRTGMLEPLTEKLP